MPTGPKGEKRPADVNARAVMIAKIATGEEVDVRSESPERAKGGRAGGKRRAENLSPEERHRIAKKAALARWGSKS
jgi:hypothetical protein